MIDEVGEKGHQKLCPSYIKRVEEIKQRVRQIDMEKIKLKKKERGDVRKKRKMRLECRKGKRGRDERKGKMRIERKTEQKAKEKEDQGLKEEENNLLRIQKDEEKQLAFCRREKNDLEEKENIRKQIREKENSATRSLINEISLIERSLKKAYQINVIEVEDEGLLENKKNIVSIDQLRFKLVEKVTKLC